MKRTRRRLFRWAGLLGVLLVLWGTRDRTLPWLAQWLDVGRPPRRADYVLILGGGLETRPFVAAALVRRGLARRALVSHVRPSPAVLDDLLPADEEVTRRVLLSRGVPADRILLLGKDNATTYDEARALGKFLESAPQARVLVPTNEYHTRRARWVFQRVLGERSRQVAFFSVPTEEFTLDTWWHTEEGFRTIVSENLKLLFYGLRYGRLGYAVAGAVLLVGLAIAWRQARGRRGLRAAVCSTGPAPTADS